MSTLLSRFGVAALCAVVLASCSGPTIPPAMRPLSKEAMMLLGKKGMKTESPIFVRIFKEESELEIWKARDDGHYYHFKTYPICMWSGGLGPKIRQGDKQAPEGFYRITKGLMNPNSSYHLAFNLGYPNAYDRAHKRTGDFVMVHGKCLSAGCYAMTDALVEEIYALAREQFAAGHDSFQVDAFPFRMTAANMARHANSEWMPFWRTLKEGYDYFETTRTPPNVVVCERRYVVNPKFRGPVPRRIDPEGRCPAYDRQVAQPFTPAPHDKVADAPQVIAPGIKKRAMTAALPTAPRGSMSLIPSGWPTASGLGWAPRE